MTIGAGLLIAALGAILTYAVTAEVAGVDIQTVGVILMIVGGAIALIALLATATRDRRGARVVAYQDEVDSARV